MDGFHVSPVVDASMVVDLLYTGASHGRMEIFRENSFIGLRVMANGLMEVMVSYLFCPGKRRGIFLSCNILICMVYDVDESAWRVIFSC